MAIACKALRVTGKAAISGKQGLIERFEGAEPTGNPALRSRIRLQPYERG